MPQEKIQLKTGNRHKPAKVLVTGSTGFIGSCLVRALLNKGYRVFCLIRKASNPERIKDLDVRLVTGSYRDRPFLSDAVRDMDFVFHVGAVIHARDWETYRQANVDSTVNLLESCARSNPGIKKFVFVSSIAAAGPAKDKIPVKESDDCRPVSFYGESKWMAEQAAARFFKDLPIVIIRPTHVLGIGQQELNFVLTLAKKRIFPRLGNGDKQISLCFVQDLVRALIMAAEHKKVKSQVYFVANREAYAWQEILNFIKKELGLSWVINIPFPVLVSLAGILEMIARIRDVSPPVTRDDILSTRRYYWLHDVGKIKKEIGFSPEVNLETGLKEIVRWYRDARLL